MAGPLTPVVDARLRHGPQFNAKSLQSGPVGVQDGRSRRRRVEPVGQRDLPVVACEVGPDDSVKLQTERGAVTGITGLTKPASGSARSPIRPRSDSIWLSGEEV